MDATIPLPSSLPVVTTSQTPCQRPFRTIEYRCQAMKKTFGLVDHYFLVVDGKEYHAGFYKPGKVLPMNTTKGYHVVMLSDVCEACYLKIVTDYGLGEDVRIFSYFPMLNCETLCRGFSIQSLSLFSLPFVVLLLYKRMFVSAILMIMVVMICVLIHSKYVFSRCKRKTCPHLKQIQSKLNLYGIDDPKPSQNAK